MPLVHRAGEARVVRADEFLDEQDELVTRPVGHGRRERTHVRVEVRQILRGGRDDVAARDEPIVA